MIYYNKYVYEFTCRIKKEKITMSEENSSLKKSQVNESSGEWGSRKGKKFTFKVEVTSIDGKSVYPLTYKSISEEKAENGKKIIVLRLSNDNESVKFYKEELYEKFGVKVRRKKKEGRKVRSFSLTDAEYKFIKEVIVKLLDDDDCAELLITKNIDEMKDLLDVSR